VRLRKLLQCVDPCQRQVKHSIVMRTRIGAMLAFIGAAKKSGLHWHRIDSKQAY
jgi:hypothetical protein